MKTYQLTHEYSRSRSFFGVKTELDLHELNLACAYLQLLRYDLPTGAGMEDGLDEEAGMLLLAEIYGMEPITTETAIDGTVDLYDNWNDYCGGMLTSYLPKLNEGYAVADVYKALLSNMLKECHDSLQRAEGKALGDDAEYLEGVSLSIERLQSLINGGAVQAEWKWTTITGDLCVGKQYVTDAKQPDYVKP